MNFDVAILLVNFLKNSEVSAEFWWKLQYFYKHFLKYLLTSIMLLENCECSSHSCIELHSFFSAEYVDIFFSADKIEKLLQELYNQQNEVSNSFRLSVKSIIYSAEESPFINIIAQMHLSVVVHIPSCLFAFFICVGFLLCLFMIIDFHLLFRCRSILMPIYLTSFYTLKIYMYRVY